MNLEYVDCGDYTIYEDGYGLKHLENLIGKCCAYLKHNSRRKFWLRVGAEPRYAKKE